MSAIRVLLICAAAGVLSVPAATEAATPSEKQVRSAITRSLPYLEKEGVWWMKEKKCVSCHRVAVMT